MHIAVLIPVHGGTARFELARRVTGYYRSLEIPGAKLWVVPLIDPSRCKEWDDNDGYFVWDEAAPVGERFNEGIAPFQGTMVDGVMIVGSDDLVAPTVFEHIVAERPVYREVAGLHFYNVATGLMLWDPTYVVGSGKYFSAEFLDRCDWRPYDSAAAKNVDKGPNRFLKPGERIALHSAMHDPCVLSIEVADNMTPWEKKTLNARPVQNKHMVFEALDGEYEHRWVL